MRTRVKICGITNIDDALAAVAAGADALGFVFYEKSPRYIAPQQAQLILQQLPPFVQTVGLVVNPTPQDIAALNQTNIQLIQFHGDETPQECLAIAQLTHKTYIKALAVKPNDNLATQICNWQQAKASAVLLDAYDPNLYGGTGHSFDWTQWPTNSPVPLILAGGLTAQNVKQAIKATQPYAVDVSGGVEAINPQNNQPIKGKKDPNTMRAFVHAVMESNA